MTHKLSKRDEQIAKATLHVYPPADAYEEFQLCINAHTWKVSADIKITCHHSRTGGSSVITGRYRPPNDCFRPLVCREWERRVPNDHSKQSWMYHFALVCLEIAEIQHWHNKMLFFQKLLTKNKLPRRMCWSKTVTDLIAKERTDSEARGWVIGSSGLIKKSCRYQDCEIDSLSHHLLDKVTQLAKDFTPSTEPITIEATTLKAKGFRRQMADGGGQRFALSEWNLQS